MGKIRDKWKSAKAAMSSETVAKLPKMDFGPQLDTYEELSAKLATQLEEMDKSLTEWHRQFTFLQGTVFPQYIKEISGKEAKAHDLIADMLRLIRGQGVSVHTEWKKVKEAKIGTLKF